jgi:serine/threonine-protein kinase RsbW
MTGSVRQARAELTIRADFREARRASAWLESAAAREGVPSDQIVRLDHCLDEALANVISHGGPDAVSATVALQLGIHRGRGICTAELSIIDQGLAFDPSVLPGGPTPKPASLAEASIGGLGLAMIRSFSDELRYHRKDGRNHLTIRVSWTETT